MVKNIKAPSAKQKLARRRNFNKFRLTGFTLDTSGLTKFEYNAFMDFKQQMISNWNYNSNELGLNVKKGV
ncbi:hypothetical protein N356_gp046 [Cellulophaga phage phi14:2]|uniref:Uncharacterized protein n=1 Tax=Cellulophaga phage phi14:2 TaxID=1327990 RepID=S0A3Y2_9CAUD|nr:hypothetical protein N356_gp046 [Cellulophaga phage phi14:2]AGO48938.1 hypothetical protein Phi14:2_gp060 [Cellulophaga phage phi14:2]